MKTTENNSGQEPRRPEVDECSKNTLEKVMDEIQKIIENSHWVETRLSKLKANGFQIENCWVKNGSIGIIWHMKRKKVFRIQVTNSELHGNHHKAFCIVIPEKEVDLRNYDIATIRNMQKK